MNKLGAYICSHVVDRSLLAQGFTMPVAMLVDFTSWFGTLSIGQTREIFIRLDGEIYPVRIGNRNFNRIKWPSHREMYQIRYNQDCAFAKALQKKFTSTRQYITNELLLHPDIGKKHIVIPIEQREQIVFYRTDNPSIWDAETQTAAESRDVSKYVNKIDETLFESVSWTDDSAQIVLRPAVIKVRRLDRIIGENLKKVYQHRCQICGQQVAISYGAHVDETHHIEPFVTSLNNDVTNLVVLCPNHHRIVHATHASFNRKKKLFVYPNGFEEKLQVNVHL